jgi:sugar lactone lactonase YvrE
MVDWQVIADYGDLCGEGPIWDEHNQVLYWTDITGRKCFRYKMPTGQHEIMLTDFEVNGMALNGSAGFVFANSQGVWLYNGSAPELIAETCDGARLQLNDCIADPLGRLITGSVFYDPSKEFERGKLFIVNSDRSIAIVDEGFEMPNGLGFSPDNRTLYFTDSAARRIYSYDYDPKTGAISHRRVFVQVPLDEGLPDGLTVDREGFVWSAQWYGSCVVRYDPDGKVERRYQVPAKQASSVAFGGPGMTHLFVTSAAKSEPMPLMPPGYDPQSGYFGGRLYCLPGEILGKPEFRANIT